MKSVPPHFADSNHYNRSTPLTMTSSHAKKSNEKYSLRQRQKRSSALKCLPKIANADNYDFDDLEAVEPRPTGKDKNKSKAAPLSKYRRKTANARERTRMREINSAFENLRKCVPPSITGTHDNTASEKLTKITTLRVAMNYISLLSEALQNPEINTDFLNESRDPFEMDMVVDSDDFSSCSYSDNGHAVVEVPVVKKKAAEKKSKKEPKPAEPARKRAATKAPAKRQRTSKNKVVDTFPSPPTSSSSSLSSYTSPYQIDDNHSMTGLSGIMLESDGESLHLSEPCLSPLGGGANSHYLHTGMPTFDYDKLSSPISASSIDNPLELSLLLESESDSLEFCRTDQQPSTCISPLVTLDPFNPFSDLLHSDFPDLYLT